MEDMKVFRPFAIQSWDRSTINCVCGTQFLLSQEARYNGEAALGTCPNCGRTVYPNGSDGLRVDQQAWPMQISGIGYNACPEVGDTVPAIMAGFPYPCRLDMGETKSGNFRIRLNMMQYDMFKSGLSRKKIEDAHYFESFRTRLVDMIAGNLPLRPALHDGPFDMPMPDLPGREDPLDLSITDPEAMRKYLIEKMKEDWWMPRRRVVKMAKHELMYETVADLIDWILPCVRKGALVTASVNPKVQADQQVILLNDWCHKPVDDVEKAREAAPYMIKRRFFDVVWILKKDGRIFYLNANPNVYRELWNANRQEYYKAKASAEKFRFLYRSALGEDRNNYWVDNVKMSDSVLNDIEKAFASWMDTTPRQLEGSNISRSRSITYRAPSTGPSVINLVGFLFDRMVAIQAGVDSINYLEFVRNTGVTDYKIVKYGPGNAVYGVIGSKVKRKSFRKDLTHQFGLVHLDEEFNQYLLKLSAAKTLNLVRNHGLATDLYEAFCRVADSHDVQNMMYLERDMAGNYAQSLSFLEFFLTPARIVEMTQGSMSFYLEGNYEGRMYYENPVESTIHATNDTARMINECMDLGLTTEAVREEIHRVELSRWTPLHDHFSDLYNRMSAMKKDAALAEYVIKDWQLELNETVEGFDFVVEHPLNLTKVGSEMSICVGAYANQAASGSTTIVTMRKEGMSKYHACLEVKGRNMNLPEDPDMEKNVSLSLVQAKLVCNKRVVTDPEALKAVKKWARAHKVTLFTNDVAE